MTFLLRKSILEFISFVAKANPGNSCFSVIFTNCIQTVFIYVGAFVYVLYNTLPLVYAAYGYNKK